MSKHRKPGKLFQRVPMNAVPGGTLFDDQGKLALHGADLSVYLYCCRLANAQPKLGDGRFKFTIHEIVSATGYSERSVWYALRRLQNSSNRNGDGGNPACKKLIVCIESKGSFHLFSVAGHDGMPLTSSYGESESSPSPLRQFLHEKQLWYDDIPTHLFEKLKSLKGAPLAVAISGYKLATDKEQVRFAVSMQTWQEKAGIARRSLFTSSWANPEFKKLIHVTRLAVDTQAQVAFYHPTRNTSLFQTRPESVASAYERDLDRPIGEYGADDTRKYTSEELRKAVKHFYPGALTDANDELVVDCPECKGTRYGTRVPSPTLRINVDKGAYGVMYCGDDLNDTRTCEYGSGKMSYHLLAHRTPVRPAVAKKMYDDYIERVLRGNIDTPSTTGSNQRPTTGLEDVIEPPFP